MRPAVLSLAVAVALLAGPGLVRAQVGVDENAVPIVVLSMGTVAGLTNTVATFVYMVEGRSFDIGWVISSYVAGAICGAAGVALLAESGSSGSVVVAPALAYLLAGGLPLAWAIRGAVSPVDPGEHFDAEVAPAALRDPFGPGRAPTYAGASLGLPPLRF